MILVERNVTNIFTASSIDNRRYYHEGFKHNEMDASYLININNSRLFTYTIKINKHPSNDKYNSLQVTEQKLIDKIHTILEQAKWKKAKVQMVREPDFIFAIIPNNSKYDDKVPSYSVWISDQKNTVELVNDSDWYVKLSVDDSKEMISIFEKN